MRIHDIASDRTLTELYLYLTGAEIARLYGMLGSMLKDQRVREFSISDEEFDHTVTIRRYHPMETVGFDARQKQLLRDDR